MKTTPNPMQLKALSDRPLVSVVLANYNYGHFLNDAVQSVLSQSYPYWELVICDDGSTDSSPEAVRDLEGTDPRISVLLKENGGQVSAWNLALQYCSGEIVCFLDSDDAFFPEKLEQVVRTFRESPRAGLVYHRYRFASEELDPLDDVAPRSLPSGWLMEAALRNGGEAFVPKTSDFGIKREVLDWLCPLPEDLPFADGFICRSATFLTEVAANENVLSYYRIHGRNAMGMIDILSESRLEALARLLKETFDHQRSFLSDAFGENFAGQLRLEDLGVYWDVIGRLYLLRGQPATGVAGFNRQQILRNLNQSRKRHIWRLLFTFPHPLSLWMLNLQVRTFEAVNSLSRTLSRRSADRLSPVANELKAQG